MASATSMRSVAARCQVATSSLTKVGEAACAHAGAGASEATRPNTRTNAKVTLFMFSSSKDWCDQPGFASYASTRLRGCTAQRALEVVHHRTLSTEPPVEGFIARHDDIGRKHVVRSRLRRAT